jgi:hypothetical protein
VGLLLHRFLQAPPELNVFPPFGQIAIKALFLAAVLLGLFCYSLELERLGRAFDDPAA